VTAGAQTKAGQQGSTGFDGGFARQQMKGAWQKFAQKYLNCSNRQMRYFCGREKLNNFVIIWQIFLKN
jgi:hypothetical protein